MEDFPKRHILVPVDESPVGPGCACHGCIGAGVDSPCQHQGFDQGAVS